MVAIYTKERLCVQKIAQIDTGASLTIEKPKYSKTRTAWKILNLMRIDHEEG